MKYYNPVLRGMYPDPSVCAANGKYYMVCSTFQFFPGVPVFESEDMVNWKFIGHCLTRPSQIMLEGVRSSGGVFAPTIRFNKGRFYMVTTNDSTRENFYVYTDDIYGEWSEPVIVEQDGIDPSLYFEDDRAYFMSNGSDEKGVGCIQMCEIDIDTGVKISETRVLWHGTGGRYLEAPHLYKFGDWYYLLEAEGGTEYGHMVNYARSQSLWSSFEPYPGNPVLTNRNLGGYALQGAGHGDIVEDNNGNWWFMHLAFRQTGQYSTFHHLGREACLEPVEWTEDGWFTIGVNGTARLEIDMPDNIKFAPQQLPDRISINDDDWNRQWCYMRIPNAVNYRIGKGLLELKGQGNSLEDCASPTFYGVRQQEFDAVITCDIKPGFQEAGITLYMDEFHHYEIAARGEADGVHVWTKARIGSISSIMKETVVAGSSVKVRIVADCQNYHFYIDENDKTTDMLVTDTKYLSSEVAGGFTGVFIGVYAVNEDNTDEWASFKNFEIKYNR